jgi:MoxR-like ATPase
MIDDLPVDKPIRLPPRGTWPASVHLFDQASADAILAALAANRPLLVLGEPGCGKSQLARAAAEHLKRAFVSSVVHSRSEAQDLQWDYDAVARLGEAQVLGPGADEAEVCRRLDPRRYLSPGPLWWVFGWASAQQQVGNYSLRKVEPPPSPEGWRPEQGCVLLIDEIDKAEADLPNSLLETLGNGGFPVPWLDGPVGLRKDTTPPLVVITTNEERELPPAFVRRCMVLHLKLPSDPGELIALLMRRGEEHFAAASPERVRRKVAEQLVEDRGRAADLGHPLPGQAEYLDILRALYKARGSDVDAQLALFKRIADYALDKAGSRAA